MATRRRAARGKSARKKATKRARKKVARKKPARKKAAPRKKAVRKKAVRKKAARKKAARKKPARKKAARKKAAPKRATRKKAAAPTAEDLARKIVRFTTNRGNMKLADIYAEGATSREQGPGEPLRGLAALEQKLQGWEGILASESWKARNVWVKGNSIGIEWDAKIRSKRGRSVDLSEVAVHEIRGGKIVAERYYYDPAVIAPLIAEMGAGAGAAGAAAPRPAPRPTPAPRPPTAVSAPAAAPPRPGPEPVRASPLDPDAADDDEDDDEERKPFDPLDL